MIHLEPDDHATTAASTHWDSENELLLSTYFSTVPSIFPFNSTDTTSISTTTYPSQILSLLSVPSTPPSGFSPILQLYFLFDTALGAHTSIPSY